MDWNLIDNLAQSTPADARNRANKGKKVNQRGWVTKEKMRQNTDEARRELTILALLFAGASKLFSLMFGKKIGLAMMITLPLAWLASTIVSHKIGCNLGWLPLWIAIAVFLLRVTMKVLGRTIGAVASIVVATVVAFWLHHVFNKKENLLPTESESHGSGEVSAMDKYFTSSAYAAISDEGQKLWHHSPQLLASLVKEELRTGKFTYPQEAL